MSHVFRCVVRHICCVRAPKADLILSQYLYSVVEKVSGLDVKYRATRLQTLSPITVSAQMTEYGGFVDSALDGLTDGSKLSDLSHRLVVHTLYCKCLPANLSDMCKLCKIDVQD